MLDGPSRLLSLPEELITTIITFCSAEDVLNLERTCRTLRLLCQDKAVWMSAIRKLHIHQAPDLPPTSPLTSLNGPDLKEKVTKALKLAHDWRMEGCLKVARKAEVCFDVGDPTDSIEARLLPGRKEVIMENHGKLELRSIDSGERIWTAPEDKECFFFEFELADDGLTLNIAAVFATMEDEDITLRVFTYDFNSCSASLVLERQVPNAFLSRFMIRGHFFSAIIPFEPEMIIINWKTGETGLIRLVDPQKGTLLRCRVAVLANEHLVSFMDIDLNVFAAVAIPISALDGHWSTSRNHGEWETLSLDPGRFSTLSEGDFGGGFYGDFPNGPYILSAHVFKPTWMDDGQSEIFVAVCDRIASEPANFNIYHLRLSSRDQGAKDVPTTCNSSTSKATKNSLTSVGKSMVPWKYMPWIRHSLSNAGRMVSFQPKVLCSSVFSDASILQNTLQLDEDIKPIANISVEPWSNAIVVAEPGRVRVFYLV